MHIDECYCDLKQATDLELMKQEEARIRNEIEQGEIHEYKKRENSNTNCTM